MMKAKTALTLFQISASILLLAPGPVAAWGDEGHKVVGLIADHYLDPDVRIRVGQILAGDDTHLTPTTGISDEATWADKYRDFMREGNNGPHYVATRDWHFVDIEIDGSVGFDKACFDHPVLPSGTPASLGPASTCAIDKIGQFENELANPSAPADERRIALQFLLHIVGDMHQPLHASDDHDSGGNAKLVKADKLPLGKLHGYWDTQFVQRIARDPDNIAVALIAAITPEQIEAWQSGTLIDWAGESFDIAKREVYGKLPAAPATADAPYLLDQAYVDNGTQIVSLQLEKAGVRLAMLLNQALKDTPSPVPSTGVQILPGSADLLIRSTPIVAHYPGVKHIGRLASGAIVFQSKLELDADGSVYCRQDASGQRDTALVLTHSKAADADRVAYFVIPLMSTAVFPGVVPGDVGVMWFHDRHVYAVVGDRGPAAKLGEASIAAFRALGEERVDKSQSPHPGVSASCKTIKTDGTEGRFINKGMASPEDPVTTVVFPGTHSEIDRSTTDALIESINRIAEDHLRSEGR